MDTRPAFDYDAAPKETVACNLCGGTATVRVATSDRYGFATPVDRCKSCGLVYQNPRLTAAAYADFYAHWYRPLVKWITPRVDGARIEGDQWEYAASLSNTVAEHMPTGGSVLDVGGSRGIVGRLFRARWGCRVTVIDPALDELQEARDCQKLHATAEDAVFPAANVALVCRAIDHFRDPLGVLRRLRDRCDVLVVDAMDVPQWPAHARYKVDHPYAFSAATLKAMVETAGWSVVQTWQRRNGMYVGFVGR